MDGKITNMRTCAHIVWHTCTADPGSAMAAACLCCRTTDGRPKIFYSGPGDSYTNKRKAHNHHSCTKRALQHKHWATPAGEAATATAVAQIVPDDTAVSDWKRRACAAAERIRQVEARLAAEDNLAAAAESRTQPRAVCRLPSQLYRLLEGSICSGPVSTLMRFAAASCAASYAAGRPQLVLQSASSSPSVSQGSIPQPAASLPEKN